MTDLKNIYTLYILKSIENGRQNRKKVSFNTHRNVPKFLLSNNIFPVTTSWVLRNFSHCKLQNAALVREKQTALSATAWYYLLWMTCVSLSHLHIHTHVRIHAHTQVPANTPRPRKNALHRFLLRDMPKPDGNTSKNTRKQLCGNMLLELRWVYLCC